jgi:hypothetical protein
MTTPDPTLRQRYADVLGPDPDATLLHLVADLDALATIFPLPPTLARAPRPPTAIRPKGRLMMFPNADAANTTPARRPTEDATRRGRIVAASLAALIVLASAILFASVRAHGGPASGGGGPTHGTTTSAPVKHPHQTPTPGPTPTVTPGSIATATPTPYSGAPTPTPPPGSTPTPSPTPEYGPTATPFPTPTPDHMPPTPTPTPSH